jgi:hypothetical protein
MHSSGDFLWLEPMAVDSSRIESNIACLSFIAARREAAMAAL